jgi:hypothetical protein
MERRYGTLLSRQDFLYLGAGKKGVFSILKPLVKAGIRHFSDRYFLLHIVDTYKTGNYTTINQPSKDLCY